MVYQKVKIQKAFILHMQKESSIELYFAVDWQLIETHWQDMIQVVLSIKAGKDDKI